MSWLICKSNDRFCAERRLNMIKKGSKLLDALPEDAKAIYLKEKEDKKREQSNGQKVLRRFAKMAKELGFVRKSNWFSREQELVAHVIHFHKYTFGSYFRMHVCIRVLNDSWDKIALNGLESSELSAYERKFEYGDNEESIVKCAEIMLEALKEVAIPWFELNTVEVLCKPDSPIIESGREGLINAVNGKPNIEYIQNSREKLGLTE